MKKNELEVVCAGGSGLIGAIIAFRNGDDNAIKNWIRDILNLPHIPPQTPWDPDRLTLEQLATAHCILQKIKVEFDSIYAQIKKELDLPEVIKFVYKK